MIEEIEKIGEFEEPEMKFPMGSRVTNGFNVGKVIGYEQVGDNEPIYTVEWETGYWDRNRIRERFLIFYEPKY